MFGSAKYCYNCNRYYYQLLSQIFESIRSNRSPDLLSSDLAIISSCMMLFYYTVSAKLLQIKKLPLKKN